jgi:4-amino-4-deoxy-L-arabinose transferase-like glycosyltransferase
MIKYLLGFKVVIFLFTVSFLLRLCGLGEHGLFSDELSWMVRGKELFFAVKQFNWSFFETGWWLNPFAAEPLGLPMALMSGTLLVLFSPGQSRLSLGIIPDIIAARIPAMIIGSLFIPVYYFLLKKSFKKEIVLVAALLLAFDPVAVGLSRWLHQDSFLTIVSFIGLILFISTKSKLVLIISAFFSAMACLTKPQGFFVPLTLGLYWFLVENNLKKQYLIRLGIWGLILGSFVTLSFPFLWKNPIGQMLLYLQTQSSVVSQGHLVYFLGEVTRNPAWYYYFITGPFHLTESVLFGTILGLIYFLKNLKEKSFKINPIVAVALIYSLIIIVTVSLAHKKLGIRYMFPIWPYLFLFAGWGLYNFSQKIKEQYLKIFWILVFLFPLWGLIKFYPSYYLYYNNLISPKVFQKMEMLGVCDGIKPSMEYLGPRLTEGTKLMVQACAPTARYYTGFTINLVENVEDNPEYIILEDNYAIRFPGVENKIKENGYKVIKEIDFRGISLTKIYEIPNLK